MRFMVIVKANKDSEAGVLPDEKLLTDDGQVQRGAGEGRRACSRARGCTRARRARASGSPGPKRTVIDGPFAETKELIAGFWLLQVKSKEEAIEWVKRCPNPFPGRSPRSRSARCSRPRTSAPSSRPSSASRRSASAREAAERNK